MNDTYGITVDSSVFTDFNSIQAVDLTCKGDTYSWAWDRTNALNTLGADQKLTVAGQEYTLEAPALNGNYQWFYNESGADDGEWIDLGNGFYGKATPSIKTKCDEQEKRYKLKYR